MFLRRRCQTLNTGCGNSIRYAFAAVLHTRSGSRLHITCRKLISSDFSKSSISIQGAASKWRLTICLREFTSSYNWVYEYRNLSLFLLTGFAPCSRELAKSRKREVWDQANHQDWEEGRLDRPCRWQICVRLQS